MLAYHLFILSTTTTLTGLPPDLHYHILTATSHRPPQHQQTSAPNIAKLAIPTSTLKQTHFEALELQPTASQDEVKKAYRRLILLHHPDKRTSSPSPSHTPDAQDGDAYVTSLNEAYRVLGDLTLRQAYEQGLRSSSRAGVEDAAKQHAEARLADARQRGRNPTRIISLDLFDYHEGRWAGPDGEEVGGPGPRTAARRESVQRAQEGDLDSTEEDVDTVEEGKDGVDHEDDDVEEEEEGYYTHPCRCSSQYVIALQQLEDGVDTVACEGCGEWVGVGYEVVEDGDDDVEDGEG